MKANSGKLSLRQRWDDYRPTKAQTFWTGVGCIVATLVLGFGPGGWVTGGTAGKMASEAADNARHQLAAAVCVEHFMRAANAGPRLQKLKDMTYYERDDLVAAGGWATMPDEKEANTVVADMCAMQLAELQAPAAARATPASATTPAK